MKNIFIFLFFVYADPAFASPCSPIIQTKLKITFEEKNLLPKICYEIEKEKRCWELPSEGVGYKCNYMKGYENSRFVVMEFKKGAKGGSISQEETSLLFFDGRADEPELIMDVPVTDVTYSDAGISIDKSYAYEISEKNGFLAVKLLNVNTRAQEAYLEIKTKKKEN